MIQSMSRSLSDSRRLSPLRRSGQHGSSRRDRETQAANKAAAGAQRRKRQKARRLNRERRSRGEESRSLGQLMTPGPGIPPRITLEDLGPEGLQMSGKWPYSTHRAAVWKVVYSCLVLCLVFLFSCSLVLLFSCSLVLLLSCVGGMGGSSVLEQIAFQQQQQGGPSRGSSMLSSAGSMLPDGKKKQEGDTVFVLFLPPLLAHSILPILPILPILMFAYPSLVHTTL